MSKLKEFTTPHARPLPVILLADVSGSMAADGKIDSMNDAISEMLRTFSEEDDTRAEIHVAVIIFGGASAELHMPLIPAREALWEPLAATGKTPLGSALQLAMGLIEDRNRIPSRSYRPSLILISDGKPTDAWKMSLRALLDSERASKADRFAMGIGDDAEQAVLETFLADNGSSVFAAHDARQMRHFFRWVTMSVTSRSRSVNPDSILSVDPSDVDDFDF